MQTVEKYNKIVTFSSPFQSVNKLTLQTTTIFRLIILPVFFIQSTLSNLKYFHFDVLNLILILIN